MHQMTLLGGPCVTIVEGMRFATLVGLRIAPLDIKNRSNDVPMIA